MVNNKIPNVYISLIMILSSNDYELELYNRDEKCINITSQEHK